VTGERRMIMMLQGLTHDQAEWIGWLLPYLVYARDDNVADSDSVNVVCQEDDCNALREDQPERSGPCEDRRHVVVGNCQVMTMKSHKHI
jgi:hypothetical protein